MACSINKVLLIAGGVAMVANADVLILNCTSANTSTITNVAPSATQSFTCPQFDPSQGTLNRYSFGGGFALGVLGAPTSGTYTVTNTGSVPISAYQLIVIQLSLTPGFPAPSPVSSATPPMILNPGQSQVFVAYPGISPILGALNSTLNLSSYIGNGTFGGVAIFNSVAPPSPGLSVQWSFVVDASVLQVKYAFTPVPEPGTVALTLAGLTMLCASRRTRS